MSSGPEKGLSPTQMQHNLGKGQEVDVFARDSWDPEMFFHTQNHAQYIIFFE